MRSSLPETSLLSHTSGHVSKWVIAAMCLAAYVILAWVSFIHVHKGLPVTPWDPGLGVVFALMVLAGPRAGLVLLAGVIIAEVLVLQNEVDWPVVIGIGAITSLSYTSVTVFARLHLQIDVGLFHLRDVLLLLVVGLAGAVIDTVLLTVFLFAVGQLNVRDVVQVFSPLLIGDMIGIAVVTPLLLRFVFRQRSVGLHQLLSIAPEGALYLVVIGAALWAIISSENLYGFRLFYLLFMPVVIAAVRHGLDGACFSLAATQFGLIGLLHLSGYNAAEFTEFQVLMLVLTVTGLIVGVVVSERENSDRLARDAQARLMERQAGAAHAARLNLVSGMASALAHEINQPLTAARALARSVQHLLGTPGADLTRAGNNLTALLAHIDHAGAIVRRMRDFIRRGGPHVSTIDTRKMLEQALTLAFAEASAKHVRLDLDAPDSLPVIHGDRVQLEQVVLNLVHNAVEAIVGTGRSEGHIRVVARHHTAPPRVEIGVLDNGPGVEDQLAVRLFDPLATSKQDGLGLGLSISASIVEAHGGRVWLHCREAGATEFRFSVPLVQSKVL
ncbi:MAG TPA: ATP-binding protein [Xanthobacteraceae bacterium]|nr:ATP-binding protein [Xanthobacteraceae bacterium]